MDVAPYADGDGRGIAFAAGDEPTVQLHVDGSGQFWWAPAGGEPASPSFVTVEEALAFAEGAFSPQGPGDDPEPV